MCGWRSRGCNPVKHSALAWSLLFTSNLLLAADDAESLDAEFLEFLGRWETTQGEWLPPGEVAELQFEETAGPGELDKDAGSVASDEEQTSEVENEE